MKSDWFHSLSLASTLPHRPCAYISPHLGVPREPCAAFPCASMQEWQTCFPWRWYPSLLKVQLCMTSSLEFALDSPFSGQSFSVVSFELCHCYICISCISNLFSFLWGHRKRGYYHVNICLYVCTFLTDKVFMLVNSPRECISCKHESSWCVDPFDVIFLESNEHSLDSRGAVF